MSLILDAADLIDSLSTASSYTVTRRAAATFTNGVAVAGSTSTFSVVAAIVPASGRDLERLPELRRSQETRTMYTATVLYVGAEGGSYEADLVTIDGVQWEVQTVRSWPAITGYFECTLQRPNTGAQP